MTETAQLTLTEFLLARLDEDEAVAKMPSVTLMDWEFDDSTEPAVVAIGWTIASEVQPSEAGKHIARHDPARVLADVAAHRAVVALHTGDEDPDCPPWGRRPDGSEPCATLLALAQPHADHPDFRDEWRP